MRALFSFEWGTKMTQGEAMKLNAVLEGGTIRLEEEIKDGDDKRPVGPHDKVGLLNYYDTFTAELIDVYQILPNAKLQVTGIAASASFNRLMERLANVEQLMTQAMAREQLFNQRCEVHVPGLGLLMINETKVVEDCCTERLDDELQQGWRIIAACPQPDQRRPDYVLGRTSPDRRP